MLLFLYHRQSSDIELNEVWEPVSSKPYTEGHDDSKRIAKNTTSRIRRALLQVCLHTQGICPDDRSFQCRRKYRHSADIHMNNTEGMEYNTNIREKQKINNIICTEI